MKAVKLILFALCCLVFLSGCEKKTSKLFLAYRKCIKEKSSEIRTDSRVGNQDPRYQVRILQRHAAQECNYAKKACVKKPRGEVCQEFLWDYS